MLAFLHAIWQCQSDGEEEESSCSRAGTFGGTERRQSKNREAHAGAADRTCAESRSCSMGQKKKIRNNPSQRRHGRSRTEGSLPGVHREGNAE